MRNTYDVAIIGGGINGCGIARDAALRGLSVVLYEKDDIAAHTSSSSSKLIHGGLRYLEQYDFSLVRKALKERERLIQIAPHFIKPIEIILPDSEHSRPKWLVRLGLYLYDNLGGRGRLPKSKSLHRLKDAPYFTPLKEAYRYGFSYFDATTDDARLTLQNALDAAQMGATVLNYHQITAIEGKGTLWQIESVDTESQAPRVDSARVLINATGPWSNITEHLFKLPSAQKLSLVKGSHIVVPMLYEGEHGYLLQHEDRRVIFVMPYHGFTMIGTTDLEYNGALSDVQINEQEKRYLIEVVNRYFQKKLDLDDIRSSWSGVRPLLATNESNPSRMSRDYHLSFHKTPQPYLAIYGGKITTYRELAEEALDLLKPLYPQMRACQTAKFPLRLEYDAAFKTSIFKKYNKLPPTLLERLIEHYGSNILLLLNNINTEDELGQAIAEDFYEREVDYLIEHEWAKRIEDVMWRRTKLGLTLSEDERQALGRLFEKKRGKINLVTIAG